MLFFFSDSCNLLLRLLANIVKYTLELLWTFWLIMIKSKKLIKSKVFWYIWWKAMLQKSVKNQLDDILQQQSWILLGCSNIELLWTHWAVRNYKPMREFLLAVGVQSNLKFSKNKNIGILSTTHKQHRKMWNFISLF